MNCEILIKLIKKDTQNLSNLLQNSSICFFVSQSNIYWQNIEKLYKKSSMNIPKTTDALNWFF